MKLSHKAINQIARIVLQAVVPTTETPYNDALFENWKYGNNYFKAEAVLDSGVSLIVKRSSLKSGCTDVIIESESEILQLLFVTGGYVFVQYIEGGKNYIAQDKAPKSVADVVATLKAILGEDVEHSITVAPCATNVRCINWAQIVERLSAFGSVEVDAVYEIDGALRVSKRVIHRASV